jgi:hypothetical protein
MQEYKPSSNREVLDVKPLKFKCQISAVAKEAVNLTLWK